MNLTSFPIACIRLTRPDKLTVPSWAPGKLLEGENYLVQMSIPNIYFHVVMAYALLRHNGVDIGKMDFLGPINWIDAGPD